MLELANYHIAKNVHIYRQGDLNIAYDVNSGSLHLLDRNTYRFITKLDILQRTKGGQWNGIEEVLPELSREFTAQELTEIVGELAELQAENLLFSREVGEVGPAYQQKPIIKAICLHVAHDCNLNCRYCFASKGSFGGNRKMMSLATGKVALDFLLNHSGERSNCEVDFFGGEPLLNFRVIKELVAYGKAQAAKAGKKIKFTLTTNAVLLDDSVAGFLQEEEISVVLSLDGRKEVHDRMRPNSKGQGSYDQVLPGILGYIEKKPNTSRYALGNYYYVRGTYTHFNPDFHLDVLHMADLGIKRISVEPVIAMLREDYAIRETDLPGIMESYDILAEELIAYEQAGKAFSFFHFNAALDDGPCLAKRLSGCGAGHEYIAISPEGDIYPCHQFVGRDGYKMGSLHEPANRSWFEITNQFREANIYAKDECRSCWARFSCSGGCHASNEAYSGKLTEVYPLGCLIQKKRLEVAYYLKIQEARHRTTV